MTTNSAQSATDSANVFGIGELAAEFDVTSRTLRLYEEQGLLKPERIGTRRLFSEGDRVRLRLILRGKRLGWSLADIRDSFDLYDSSSGEEAQLESMLDKLADRRQTLESQKQDVERAIEELDRIESNARTALKEIRK